MFMETISQKGGGVTLATISDIARLAGLSVSTVSRVINKSPHVSDKKRKAVESAMNELGYVADDIDGAWEFFKKEIGVEF